MKKSITPNQIKQNNRSLIYHYIYKNEKVSQQDISYDLRLSRPTVTANLNAMEQEGLICKNGQIDTEFVGRKASAYSIVANHRISIGVEILRKEVKMIAEYQARTRSGAFVEQFALCVSINFNIDNNGGVFYIGTTYSSSTDLFNWQGYGASLSTTAEGNSVFSSTSYLYFRVSDQGNCLVKVPVSFKGSYNFKDNKGTYSFTLSKAAN